MSHSRTDLARLQSLTAELSDLRNGTPCEQIRTQQAIERAESAEARVQQLEQQVIELDHCREAAGRTEDAEAEAASLRHDIARHVVIATEATNEAASLRTLLRDAQQLLSLQITPSLQMATEIDILQRRIDAAIAKGQG